ncbi:MAG: hypothetical protein RI995_1642 [Bacteroidota bacterium]|jgi:hypothetical protein
MKFYCSFLLFILFLANSVQAETIPADSLAPAAPVSLWKKDFQIGANLNQSSFSSNWKSGGSNTFAGGWFLTHSAKFDNAGWRLNSDLNMQLGFLQNQSQSLRKNVDRIFYEFKAGYRISNKWDFFGSTNFQTQFLTGYEYGKKNYLGIPVDSLVSSLFAPAYLTSSLGFEVHPNKNFFSRFGIGSLRQTFVLDKRISNAGLYGLEKPGDNIRNQFVLQLIFNIDRDIFENINLKARYSGLFDYFRLSYPGAYVHRFDTTISMKVNKYVNANLQAILLRDRDQDPNWQFSQAISLGFLYRIVN